MKSIPFCLSNHPTRLIRIRDSGAITHDSHDSVIEKAICICDIPKCEKKNNNKSLSVS